MDIPNSQAAQPQLSNADGDSDSSDSRGPRVNIYDENNVVFISPMFLIHRSLQRSLSLKVSLLSFLRQAVDPCKAQLSLIYRQFNKQLFITNLKRLLVEKKLTLSQTSKIFVKINQVYK